MPYPKPYPELESGGRQRARRGRHPVGDHLAKQGAALRITAPARDVIVSGTTRIEVAIEPVSEIANVKTVTFSVNGRLACMLERPPFTICSFEPGDVVRGHHIRVVATLNDGRRLVDNLHTKEIGYAEKIRTSAVLVPLIVTNGGTFVKGLKQQDFEIFEDGVRQPIDSLVTDDAPLDLVLAIDVSGSMERALVDVKPAVKQLLSRLRTGDAATLVGFNDTMFIAAEREKDRRTREDAVDLLTSWGGTALYDATVRTLELVSRETGRKGIVIFSDGDDRNSLTRRETAMERVQASDAMLYTIGFGGGATVPQLRASLEAYARPRAANPSLRNTPASSTRCSTKSCRSSPTSMSSRIPRSMRSRTASGADQGPRAKGSYDPRARDTSQATHSRRKGKP